MDEAERCHRIDYISYGKMLATGTVARSRRASGLSTFIVTAPPSADLGPGRKARRRRAGRARSARRCMSPAPIASASPRRSAPLAHERGDRRRPASPVWRTSSFTSWPRARRPCPRRRRRHEGAYFSISRWLGILAKEFIQMRRDRVTFAMMLGIPIMQLMLFGYAINTDPKRLPTRRLLATGSDPYSRAHRWRRSRSATTIASSRGRSRGRGRGLLATGEVAVRRHHPERFRSGSMRGERPALLVEADATDPAATSNAIARARISRTNGAARDQGRWRSLARRSRRVRRYASIPATTRRRDAIQHRARPAGRHPAR